MAGVTRRVAPANEIEGTAGKQTKIPGIFICMTSYLIGFVSFATCLVLTPAVRYFAIKNGWMANPVGNRWHKKPTALMGGVAIYLSMAALLFMMSDFSVFLPETAPEPAFVSFGAVLFVGVTFLFVLGLVDDFFSIKPYTKLIGQILVAAMVTFMGFRLHWFESLTIDTMVTLIWIVGITNAFNLIDNMDGLCAGVAFIAAAYLAILFEGTVPDSAFAAKVLCGALAGFLVYNFNPASIFMGDSGSLVIGFSLSMLTLNYCEAGLPNAISSSTVPIMILMVPILDTTMVTLIRVLSGRRASTGGKDHTSHRLALIGLSEKGAVSFLYGVGAISGISALFVHKNDSFTSPVVIIPLAVSILLMGVYLAQLRVYPEKEFSMLRDRPFTPVLMELTYKRQILMISLDLGLIAFAYYFSYRLRFDSKSFPYYFQIFLKSLPAVIACKLVAFYVTGIYKGFWRYLSTSDVFTYLKASFFATLLSVVAVTFFYRFKDFSKGLFVMDFLLTTGFLLGTRGSFRISHDAVSRKTLDGESVIIYGAGRGGELLLREILNNRNRKLKPVGFIDDDALKKGKKIQGCSILGTYSDIETLSEKHNISGILISFSNGDSDRIEGVKKFCKTNGLFLRRFSIGLEDVDLEERRL